MSNPLQFALNMIRNNPQIANNPQAQHYIQVLESGNEEEGRKIAENLCKSYGVTPEQAVQQAQSFFMPK